MNLTKTNKAIKKAIPVSVGVAGRKRSVVLKAKDRSVVHDTGWSNNLITDAGLDAICKETGASFFANGYNSVGTGNTAPANTDTALVSLVAETNYKIAGAASSGYDAGGGFVYSLQGWEFSEGTFNGENLSEIGFRRLTSDPLGSRSLYLDGSGSPTTFNVQSDEILQNYYEFRYYYPTTDISTSVIDTTTAINHAMTIRASEVNTGWQASRPVSYNSNQTCNTYIGSLGAVDGRPSSPSGSGSNVYTVTPYVDGTYKARRKYSFDLSRGNTSNNEINAIRFNMGGTVWQASFTPAIEKDSSKKWDIEFEVSVSRATI